MMKMNEIVSGVKRVSAWASAKVASVVAIGVASASAHAAPDVTTITAAGADVAAIGAAVFSVYVGIKLVKWVRRAL